MSDAPFYSQQQREYPTTTRVSNNNESIQQQHTVAVKIVQPLVEKKLFLLQLRNESHCKFPTYLLLKLITLSVLVLSFRLKSSVVQVLLKEEKNTSNFSRVKILQPT